MAIGRVKERWAELLVLTLIMLLLMVSSCLAQGEGAASPGTPGKKPLHLISVKLIEGGLVANQVNLPLNPKFQLEFDKNVVNATIWETNRKCFSLAEKAGASVPVKVSKVDDTIDFSKRQLIFLQPINNLKPGTIYLLRIAPELKAKNGFSTLGGTSGGKEVVITFQTKGHAKAGPLQPREEKTPFVQWAKTNWLMLLAILLIIIWITAELFKSRKKSV